MFNYFSVLHRKFDLPVYPIAVFSYDRPTTPSADIYSIELFGAAILRFQFQPVQLNRMNWREFLNKPNPVASALMTKMKISPEDRPKVKLECLRMITTLKLDPARADLIAVFMKSYLALTAAEEVVYHLEREKIDPVEKELVMKYTSEWEDRGAARGQLDLVIRQLNRRFGALRTETAESIQRLSGDQLGELAEALLDFKSLAELTAWLAHVPSI